uniref:Succinate dehydrogenase assembly factor 2, mitochondrial n=1 Tax=Chlamydomonas leiostraca TaxID=1034604 RepID=A0A7S0R4C6_9CHLO|mmetsp:Transcript_136/g.292  ORF Transcript_136/g.292 Transcript_136/m.292 type:complete len:172 (+) Transcript_136:96-611(+)|eukprot:CAMPEP_0202867484 /NCGR_PEP_ID=MMETSP1391-20130828/9462_1 /ASSEMBLY_ACC=CAM_ASM_000867 /TAXON_ID=1034604 /ORGANISM="Chlamydomonas leiostraca, Strain SAG 11-49" /LENGTH=171 /DNA_ID=CAMNT_0049547533 /DNA_START=83 /DNA_END=598 /DNA_ORIENTATION=-
MLRQVASRLLTASRQLAVADLPAGVASTSSRCTLLNTLGYASDALSDDARRKAMQSKLLYRSKQRGFLELDLLVGLWAEQNIPQMDLPMLDHMTVLLDQENPDLFKWLTGQLPAPEHMLKNSAYVALRGHVAGQLSANAAEGTHAAQGKEWVRGWDDSWRGAPEKQAPAKQ